MATEPAARAVHQLPTAGRAVRHDRIVALLSAYQVRSQSELAALLRDAGVHVTQATLSRDLDELGAVKLRAPDGGLPVYVVPEDGAPFAARAVDDDPPHRLTRLLGDLLVSAGGQREPGGAADPRPERPTSSPAPWTARACARCWVRSPATTRSS